MISDRPAAQVKDPFLGSLIEQLDAVLLDVHALTEGLTPVQLNWTPSSGRWSIGQCLEHLTRTVRLYPAEIERMIGESRIRTGSGARPYREGWLARRVVSGMEPPPKMRIRTIRKVEPPPVADRDTVLSDFEAAHTRLRELIVASDGVSLRHGRMQSPFVPLIRFTLGQVLALNIAHARRHLWQARQVLKHPNFPA